MSCGVGHRRGSDLALLLLWCRLAAVAPIQPLVWEPPFVMGGALKRKKIDKNFKNKILKKNLKINKFASVNIPFLNITKITLSYYKNS